MPTKFRIPKQTDRELVSALGRIRTNIGGVAGIKLSVSIPHGGSSVLPPTDPELEPAIQHILKEESLLIKTAQLQTANGNTLLYVERKDDQISDEVMLPDEAYNTIDQSTRARVYISVFSNARKELRAPDLEAAFNGVEDSEWNRYRDAQMAVINSLQQTSENLLIKVADKNAELDRDRAARFEKLETNLRAELAEERKNLQAEIDANRETLTSKEQEISQRESNFNTKEARYVARQKQDEQIKQINEWLDKWKLTTGTEEKRRPIFRAYVTALILTGLLTLVAFGHNYWIARSAADLSKLEWWHWVLLTLKAIFPLAAFSTFIVYFIRWSSAWARQHSEEEFRNRTRVIDIGRSSWLLEAVRDAQDRNKELPPELLQELSRNLFANPASAEPDIHPHAVSDRLLQGLSSLRVKSPSGVEVEAKRGKEDK
jgi:hypothetical protein